MAFFIFYHFRNLTWLLKYRTTQGPTQNFSEFKTRCGFTYNRSFVLILAWCGIEILIYFGKRRKLCKMAFSTYLSVSPWQQWTCKQMFEHSLGSLQGHWWGFISRNYIVWPIFFLMNVFLLLKDLFFFFFFFFFFCVTMTCCLCYLNVACMIKKLQFSANMRPK